MFASASFGRQAYHYCTTDANTANCGIISVICEIFTQFAFIALKPIPVKYPHISGETSNIAQRSQQQ